MSAGPFRVVLVGRPNVGKSALFNRLSGSRQALVHDRPGMTRDSYETPLVTDSGRPWSLVDTGGLDLDAVGGFAAWTSEKALDAVVDAGVLVLVLDGADGLLPEDRRLAGRLRLLGKPVLVVWNKADRRDASESAQEATELGFDETFAVSALHGLGADDLLEAIEARIPEDADAPVRQSALRLAIVGRPNVGKSSLINRILGKERVMVSEVPGTTRNPVDVPFEKGGKPYLLVDTAGIRRKGKTVDPAEILSVVAARKSLERAEVVLVVFDASMGITSQDATIAGYAEDAGRGIILLANKWDLLQGDHKAQAALREDVKRRFVFTRKAPFLTISAKTGFSTAKVLPAAEGVARRMATRIPTGELNRALRKAFETQTPRSKTGREMKIKYAVQVSDRPPVIRLFADRAEPLHFSFARFLQNRIREQWDLDGVPVRLTVTKSD